jgi:hypothetical protein
MFCAPKEKIKNARLKKMSAERRAEGKFAEKRKRSDRRELTRRDHVRSESGRWQARQRPVAN